MEHAHISIERLEADMAEIEERSARHAFTSSRLLPKRQVRRRHTGWRLSNCLFLTRAEHVMSQTDLAQRVGVTRRTISGIEHGRHEPAVGLALAIAEVFEVPVHDIFKLRRIN